MTAVAISPYLRIRSVGLPALSWCHQRRRRPAARDSTVFWQQGQGAHQGMPAHE